MWLTWWLGNMAGAILVTPCFLLWPAQTQAGGTRRPLLWQAAALASLFAMGLIVVFAMIAAFHPGISSRAGKKNEITNNVQAAIAGGSSQRIIFMIFIVVL